jgi:hypothetical protein
MAFVRAAVNYGDLQNLREFPDGTVEQLVQWMDWIEMPHGSVVNVCPTIFNNGQKTGRRVPRALPGQTDEQMRVLQEKSEEHDRNNVIMKKLQRAELAARVLQG